MSMAVSVASFLSNHNSFPLEFQTRSATIGSARSDGYDGHTQGVC